MDLGISGRTAIVCGSSSGIGHACARALAAAGVSVIINGRREAPLADAAKAIAEHTGNAVRPIVADIATAEGRATLLAACPAPDILVNNAAGPPVGSWRDFDETAWHDALRIGMISPIELTRSVLDAMIARRWGRIINITSSATKAPLPMLGLSNGARSGLTGYVAGLAREVAAFGVTINNLLPGKIETDRLRSYARAVVKDGDLSAAIGVIASRIPAGRVGRPEEMGAYCAFLASEHAGFVTGQNLLVDGGEYPGL